jgi:hypothetical protein
MVCVLPAENRLVIPGGFGRHARYHETRELAFLPDDTATDVRRREERSMCKVKDFNQICGDLSRYQEALGDPPPSMWAQFALHILHFPEIKALARATGAASLLTCAYEVFREEGDAEMADARRPYSKQYMGLRSAAHSLLESGVSDEAQLKARFRNFVDSARSVMEEKLSQAGAEAGLAVSVDLPSTTLAGWPSVSLLRSQIDGLEKIIVDLGRQTGDQSWKEWFEAKFKTFSSAIPGLAELAAWTALAKFVNIALGGVGLIPIGGTNIVTFGSNLLTPVQALIKFPAFMVTQGLLYDLHKYGQEKLRLQPKSPVMAAIKSAIDSIDWAAVQMAFKITPAGLLITMYSTGKMIYTWARPEKGLYAKDAKALLAAADIHEGSGQQMKEGGLARMAIMALSGSYEDYIKIMTERIKDAEKDLSSKMDA